MRIPHSPASRPPGTARRVLCTKEPRPLSGRGQRRGAAVVELAVVLPLLLLIVFGCVDFGRVAYHSIALNNATGAGAAYAATHRFTEFTRAAWESRVREAVIEEMQHVPDFDPGALQTEIETLAGPNDNVRVTVEARYPFHTLVEWPALPTRLLLRRTVSAMQYR